MTTYDDAVAYAAAEGTADGRAAASWMDIDDASAPVILRGIDDGDPAVLDMLPYPDLSGMRADTRTGPQLAAEAIAAGDVGPHAAQGPFGHAPGACETCDAFDATGDILDAYKSAFTQASEDAIAARCRYIIDGGGVGVYILGHASRIIG